MATIIAVNAGHGGSDPGAVGSVQEKDVNLDVARRVVSKLNAAGYDARLTRNSDIHMYLTDRADIANAAGAALYLSVHHNGGGGAYACDICYPGSTEGVRLANLFLEKWCALSGIANSGVIQRDDTDVTASNMPAVIGEAWFVDNAAHANNYVNGNWAELEATAWLNTVNAYFGNADQQPAASTTASAPAQMCPTVDGGDATIKQGQLHSANFTGHTITADGVVGEETNRQKVRVLQRALNADYAAGIAEDGEAGSETYGALGSHYVEAGETQFMVTAAEILLLLHGYDPAGVECPGVFGDGLGAAVEAFQRDNGLTIDRICGVATFSALIA